MDQLMAPALLSPNFYYAYKYFEWRNHLEERTIGADNSNQMIGPEKAIHGWDSVDGSSILPLRPANPGMSKPIKVPEKQSINPQQNVLIPFVSICAATNLPTDAGSFTDERFHRSMSTSEASTATMDSSSCPPNGVTVISPNMRNESMDSSHPDGPVPLEFSSPAPDRRSSIESVVDCIERPPTSAIEGPTTDRGLWWTNLGRYEEILQPADLSVPASNGQPLESEESQLGDTQSDGEINLGPESVKRKQKEDIKIQPYALRGTVEVFQCPLCSKSEIFSRGQLTDHLQEHQSSFRREDYKHVCCFCFSELSSNSSLERHLLTHTNHRPFNCTFCDKAFTTNGNLSRHIRTSHQVKSDNDVNSFGTNGPNQTNWYTSIADESTVECTRKESGVATLFRKEDGLLSRLSNDNKETSVDINELQNLSQRFDRLNSILPKEDQTKGDPIVPYKTSSSETLGTNERMAPRLSPVISDFYSKKDIGSISQGTSVYRPLTGKVQLCESGRTSIPVTGPIHSNLDSLEKTWTQTNLLSMASVRLQNTTLFQLISEHSTATSQPIQSGQKYISVAAAPFGTNLLTTLWPQMSHAFGTPLELSTASNLGVTSTPIRTNGERQDEENQCSKELKYMSSTPSSNGIWNPMDSDLTNSSRLPYGPVCPVSLHAVRQDVVSKARIPRSAVNKRLRKMTVRRIFKPSR
ncbi:Ras responsive element binding protein 1 [Fasciola gigantica]|uniref:Ras responsive element binding protein 1 n=1 Tax=Fasciola gigantica TaxID=46835 RepID=A0A504YZQ2_FASGI|nr:Ras responsive element binding protein 1 [Fasciola gigantica]